MAADPRMDPEDEPPRWVRVWWPPVARLAVFIVGAVLTLRGSPTETQIIAGATLMLAAAGLAVARWMER